MREEYDKIGIERNWPGYQVVEVLGKGAYGKVYKIKKEQLNNEIFSAVKVIHVPNDENVSYTLRTEGLSRDEIKEYYKNQIDSLLRENDLMQKLKGAPNIVNIEDCIAEKDEDDEDGYTLYIKMELLESLETLMQSYQLGEDDIVTIGKDICDALIVCEQKNIVHRDIKPANIFINEFGTFKLGDFGIARQMEHAQTNMTQVGTAMYMAPELYHEGKADNRVDIYSLGIMLYRLANHGKFPFVDAGKTNVEARQQALVKRLKGEMLPMPANVDSELGRIILKACAYNPEQRYRDARELKKDLERWKYRKEFPEETNQHHNIPVKNDTHNKLKTNNGSNHKKSTGKIVGIAGAAGIAVLVLVGAMISQSNSKPKQDTFTQNTVADRTDIGEEDINSSTTDTVESATDYNTGDIITFGNYEQDNDITNDTEEIEWIVIAKKDNKYLLLSQYGLENKKYNEMEESTTWKDCSLRSWLNDTFYEKAFSDEEQEKICSTVVSADYNPEYDTDPGHGTTDKIFLLSYDEVKEYLTEGSQESQCAPTEYSGEQNAWVSGGKGYWWLRTPGQSDRKAAEISPLGTLTEEGYSVESEALVRPALWIEP